MKNANKKVIKREKIKRKIRAKIAGTSAKPRLSVFRSNKFIYAQLIDDDARVTLVSASDAKEGTAAKAERARIVGEKIAKAAAAKGITSVVFDRNGFRYTGRVKLLADEARKHGLVF